MSIAAEKTEWVLVTEAARLLGVSRPTLYLLLEGGLLPMSRSTLTGRPRIFRAALTAFQNAASQKEQEGLAVIQRNGHQEAVNGVHSLAISEEAQGAAHPIPAEASVAEAAEPPRPSLWPPGTPDLPKLEITYSKLTPIPPPSNWPEDGPPWSVDSIFQLHKLDLRLPVNDLAERLDFYRFHGLPQDAASDVGHLGTGRNVGSDRKTLGGGQPDDE